MTERHKFHDHFSGVAASYAAARPTYPREVYKFVAQSAPSTERAWDCATGSGQAAVGLSGYFNEVYGTDASQEQIENAIPGENISYSVLLAESTDFPTRYFDAVTIAQALHWLNLDDFTDELVRVLKPSGVVIAWTYGFFRINPSIDEVIDNELFPPIEPFWPKENKSAWAGYKDINLPFQTMDTPEIPMTCQWNLPELMTYLSTWSAVSKYNAQYGPSLLERVTDKVSLLWGEPKDQQIVKMDFHLRAWRNVSGT